jgi:hypothetical protein
MARFSVCEELGEPVEKAVDAAREGWYEWRFVGSIVEIFKFAAWILEPRMFHVEHSGRNMRVNQDYAGLRLGQRNFFDKPKAGRDLE